MSNTPTDVEIWQMWMPMARMVVADPVEFARAVLAKWGTSQPVVREPLTHDEALDAFCRTPGIYQFVQAFMSGVRFAEQAHGITQKVGQHG